MSHTAEIMLDDVPLDIKFNYYAGEAATRDYPGCDAEYEIIGVYLHNSIFDISNFMAADMDARIVAELEKQMGDCL